MWNASKNMKCCLSCANWGGSRVVSGSFACCDSPSVTGKCYAGVPSCFTSGTTACGGNSCNKYETWSALKR